jgi:hypothetical protein
LKWLARHGERERVAAEPLHVDDLQRPGAETTAVGLDSQMMLGDIQIDPQAGPGLIGQQKMTLELQYRAPRNMIRNPDAKP